MWAGCGGGAWRRVTEDGGTMRIVAPRKRIAEVMAQ